MIVLITEGLPEVFNFPCMIDRHGLISLVLLHLLSDIKHTSCKDKVIKGLTEMTAALLEMESLVSD